MNSEAKSFTIAATTIIITVAVVIIAFVIVSYLTDTNQKLTEQCIKQGQTASLQKDYRGIDHIVGCK